jgi:hypothetical protein
MVTPGERSPTMSIAEILPAVRALPRSEKIRLARLLLDDLAGEELLSPLKQGQEFPIETPEFTPPERPPSSLGFWKSKGSGHELGRAVPVPRQEPLKPGVASSRFVRRLLPEALGPEMRQAIRLYRPPA